MKNGKISVHGGVVNVDPSIYKWMLIGSTCPTTLRVNDDRVKHAFRFFPGDQQENLVLMASHYMSDELVLFHIKRRDDGFLEVKENPEDAKHVVGLSHNYQVRNSSIELQIGSTRYTNDARAIANPGETVMIADASDILKFIAGHIKVKDLRAGARRAERRISLERRNRELEGEVGTAQRRIRTLEQEVESLNRQMVAASRQLAA